jgi:hypothetical protein
MQSLIAFIDSCCRRRAITYFGYAEILAPTAVFVWVLRIKTTEHTPVGAISDRPPPTATTI